MSKEAMFTAGPGRPDSSSTQQSRTVESRRRLVRALVSGGAGAATLPYVMSWTRPAVKSVILPVHARTTASGQQSFTTPGSFTFPVPDGVNELDVELAGAQGGDWIGTGAQNFRPGGEGGITVGTISVTPGETLNIIVGQQGGQGYDLGTVLASPANRSMGGSPDGGDGNSDGGIRVGSAGGGGSSRIVRDGTNLAIGGGGGGAASSLRASGGTGGDGGGNGQSGEGGSDPDGGGGGVSGGNGGSAGSGGGGAGTGGSASSGGDAVNGSPLGNYPNVGGGGGGGLMGGGSGANSGGVVFDDPGGAGGGGGGSGLAPGGGNTSNGGNSGDGYVSISW